MPLYSKLSPYSDTELSSGYLGVATFRNVTAQADDILFTVSVQYERRPDLLAYDLYGDSALWWVFSVRNKNVLLDPVYDMVAGAEIYLPRYDSLKIELGL